MKVYPGTVIITPLASCAHSSELSTYERRLLQRACMTSKTVCHQHSLPVQTGPLVSSQMDLWSKIEAPACRTVNIDFERGICLCLTRLFKPFNPAKNASFSVSQSDLSALHTCHYTPLSFANLACVVHLLLAANHSLWSKTRLAVCTYCTKPSNPRISAWLMPSSVHMPSASTAQWLCCSDSDLLDR